MACSNRPGPAAYRHYIEQITGQKINQQEWHDLRELAALEGRGTSRQRVTPEQAVYTAAYLGGAMRLEFGDDPDTREGRQKAFDDMAVKLNATNVTEGTVNIVRYLADYGIKDSLALARQYRKNGGSLLPSDGAVPPAADSRDEYAARVRAFEDLGMTTSDAQAAVEAEDILAKPKKRAAAMERERRLTKEAQDAATGEWDYYVSDDGEVGIERSFTISGYETVANIHETEEGIVASVTTFANYGGDEGMVAEREEGGMFRSMVDARDWVDAWEVQTQAEADAELRRRAEADGGFTTPPF